ncbi:hypothetical protein [Nostoc sp.]|uniref:hypothetical protein n=1 Tax=Nostoc sp. TaxID=1180 RepID=UPI002FEFACFF
MLKIIQIETDEHKSHIQELFWEYFNETKLIFSDQFGINLDVNTFFEQYMGSWQLLVILAGGRQKAEGRRQKKERNK